MRYLFFKKVLSPGDTQYFSPLNVSRMSMKPPPFMPMPFHKGTRILISSGTYAEWSLTFSDPAMTLNDPVIVSIK